MTREAIIIFMQENPNVKITHTLFDSNEYIYLKEDGNVYDENGFPDPVKIVVGKMGAKYTSIDDGIKEGELVELF